MAKDYKPRTYVKHVSLVHYGVGQALMCPSLPTVRITTKVEADVTCSKCLVMLRRANVRASHTEAGRSQPSS